MSDNLVERLARVGDALSNNMKYNAPPAFAHSVQLAIDKIQAQKSLIQEMREALNEIRELNLENADENGHRWANSDMINQTVVLALSKAKSQQEGETE